jgi:hypothetical protein
VKSVEVHFISGCPAAYIRSVRHTGGGAIVHCMLHIFNSLWLALTKHPGIDANRYAAADWLGGRQFALWGLYEAVVLFSGNRA